VPPSSVSDQDAVAADLGRIGVWTTYRTIDEGSAGEAAKAAEDLGYGTFWLGGSPQLPTVRPLLEATERLVVATGIVNIWAYEPDRLADEFGVLQRDFPGRLLLGLGVGHPEATSHYARPLTAMRRFLDGLDAAAVPVAPQHRCLAALGPRMLRLSAERTRGTIPYFVAPEHTAFARKTVGPGALVAPELACVLDEDLERARTAARRYAKLYLGLRNYTDNLLRHGFTEQDIAGGGSDRLIDAVIPHGSAAQVAMAVQAHFDAGADHVCLQPLGAEGVLREQWAALAAALS
jgi:probable F420-dependent oxidoreductase